VLLGAALGGDGGVAVLGQRTARAAHSTQRHQDGEGETVKDRRRQERARGELRVQRRDDGGVLRAHFLNLRMQGRCARVRKANNLFTGCNHSPESCAAGLQ
jgi:hypothetical protein